MKTNNQMSFVSSVFYGSNSRFPPNSVLTSFHNVFLQLPKLDLNFKYIHNPLCCNLLLSLHLTSLSTQHHFRHTLNSVNLLTPSILSYNFQVLKNKMFRSNLQLLCEICQCMHCLRVFLYLTYLVQLNLELGLAAAMVVEI